MASGQSTSSIPHSAGAGKEDGEPTVNCFICDTVVEKRKLISRVVIGWDGTPAEKMEAGIVDDDSEVSLVQLLISAFGSEPMVPSEELHDPGFCQRCAHVAAQFYGAYNSLRALSTPTVPITKMFQQFQNWHLNKPKNLAEGKVNTESGVASSSKVDKNRKEKGNEVAAKAKGKEGDRVDEDRPSRAYVVGIDMDVAKGGIDIGAKPKGDTSSTGSAVKRVSLRQVVKRLKIQDSDSLLKFMNNSTHK